MKVLRDFPLFSFEFVWPYSKFPCLGKKTEGNFHYLFHNARHFIKQQKIGRIIINDHMESGYAAYFYFAPHDMALIFLTFAGCFFFSLPGIQKLINNS